MNIDQMLAGVELDVLVAEAMGYVKFTPLTPETFEALTAKTGDSVFIVVKGISSISDDRVYVRQPADDKFTRFAPSTDIRDTWEVVAQITAAFFLEHPFTVGDSWRARFEDCGDGTWQDEAVVSAMPSTAPLAICRAALKFVEAVEAREANEH